MSPCSAGSPVERAEAEAEAEPTWQSPCRWPGPLGLPLISLSIPVLLATLYNVMGAGWQLGGCCSRDDSCRCGSGARSLKDRNRAERKRRALAGPTRQDEPLLERNQAQIPQHQSAVYRYRSLSRARLEAFSDSSGKLQLSLQEIIDWLTLKDEELSEQLPIGGDVGAVQHQRDFHMAFMEDVKSRGPFIYSVLESAQDFLSQHPFVEPEEALPDSKDVSPRRRIQNASRSVWKQANVASDLWEKLTARCLDRHRHMEHTLERLLELQAAMEELAGALDQGEGVQGSWEPVGDLFIDSLQDHIDATKLFKEELTQVKEGMKHINDLAHQLAIADVHLSVDNARALEQLNTGWKQLQGSIDERLKQLQDAHRDFGPGSQHFLSSTYPITARPGSVQIPWERSISHNKVPYYINPSSSPRLPHADTHSRIEHFASRLAEMENQNCSFFTDSLSPDESLDEDQYLLRHSSPTLEQDSLTGQQFGAGHLLGNFNCEDKDELERILARLENENRILQGEYRRLKWQHEEAAASPQLAEGAPGSPMSLCDDELLAEARILRQHKSRLETRMQILEDHNKQLESQLNRLRELLLQPKEESEANESAASSVSSSQQSRDSQREDQSRETPDTEVADLLPARINDTREQNICSERLCSVSK
ncbi:UNVERIFIED_CONTAM: hypothetical protein FKN15_010105 [Acipenser sinensis]